MVGSKGLKRGNKKLLGKTDMYVFIILIVVTYFPVSIHMAKFLKLYSYFLYG